MVLRGLCTHRCLFWLVRAGLSLEVGCAVASDGVAGAYGFFSNLEEGSCMQGSHLQKLSVR